ncbi:MAG: DUF1800 domain-containing protein [Fimbriimonadia bacterium]|jgi:uncharacterized protein (DUF1800 family)
MALQTTRDKVSHLLRRASFGASVSEVEELEKLGVEGAVDRLLDFEKLEEGFDLPIEPLAREGRLAPPVVALWWTARMLLTRRPLQEKMVLFWHDHFACSGEKVTSGNMLYAQNQLFRRLALSDFRTILTEVSKDPAMILYLDTQTNVRGRPNENYAREIMELFTLGEGNYTEADIQEAARAFTGWSIQRPQSNVGEGDALPMATFVKRPRLHDGGTKKVLGQEGAFDGEDICRILVEHPASRRYICKKLWEFFAYPDPEESVIRVLSERFFQSGYSVKAAIRYILTSKEFYSDKAERALYKSPVDFVVGTARALGIGEMLARALRQNRTAGLRGLVVGRSLEQAMARMGQQLLYPPSVAGWDGGAAWINSATMVERIKLADMLFAPSTGTRVGRGVPAQALFGEGPHESVERAVDKALQVLDARLPREKRQILVETVNKAGGTSALSDTAKSQGIARGVARLVFASPEYQFC